MASSYARRYLLCKERSTQLFRSISIADILLESYWMNRTIHKLKNLPSQDTTTAVGLLLAGFQGLPLSMDREQRLAQLDKLCRELGTKGQSGAMASRALLACL
jgi:hypothetical protein